MSELEERLGEVSMLVQLMLMAACIFPMETRSKHHQLGYRLFKWIVGLSFVHEVLRYCVLVYTAAECSGQTVFHDPRAWICVYAVAAVLPLHFAMRHLFCGCREGLVFMAQMSLQEFNWASLNRSMLVFAVVAASVLVSMQVADVKNMSNSVEVLQDCRNPLSVGPEVVLAMQCVSFPSTCFVTAFVMATKFQVLMLSKLHEYELQCYAGATAMSLKKSDDPLPFLEEVEVLIGERFRHAGQTWAVAAVRCIVLMGLMSMFLLLQLLQLLAGHEVDLEFFWLLALLAAFLVVMALLGLPMARVSSVVEYDVVKTLNTPVVLKHAQKHLGQQLLSHLSNLEWGFRIWGVEINMRLVSSFIITALTAIVVVASQAMADMVT